MQSIHLHHRYQICLDETPLEVPYYRSRAKAQRVVNRLMQAKTDIIWHMGSRLQVIEVLTVARPLAFRVMIGYRALFSRNAHAGQPRTTPRRILMIFGACLLGIILLVALGVLQVPALLGLALLLAVVGGGAIAHVGCLLADFMPSGQEQPYTAAALFELGTAMTNGPVAHKLNPHRVFR